MSACASPETESVTSSEGGSDDVFPSDLPNNIMDDTRVDHIEDDSCDLIDYLFENDSQVTTESSAHLPASATSTQDVIHNIRNDESLHDDDDVDLFDGCPLKLSVSTALIMAFILRHKLSMKASEDLVQLICAHFPTGHSMMTSLFKLKSYWKKKCPQPQYTKHHVCVSCDTLLEQTDSLCSDSLCSDPECRARALAIPPSELSLH